MRTLALLGILAAGSAFGVTITVVPTLGPDFGFTGQAPQSPNYPNWAANVIQGLINNTTPGSGVEQFVGAVGPVMNGNEFIATPSFDSWMGSTSSPLAPGQFGTAMYFAMKAIGGSKDQFFLADLSVPTEIYLGQDQVPHWVAGDFTDFSFRMVGRKASNGQLTTGGEDAFTTALTELYYVGVGFVQPLIVGPGTNQAQIDATVLAVQGLQDKTTSVCYSIGNTSNGCGSVRIANVPANGVPEPGTILLMGAGLAGVAFLRRRSA